MQNTRAGRKYPYNLNTRMDFGKHIGSKIKLLIMYSDTTRSYLQWAKKNIEGFQLHPDAEQLLQKWINKEHYLS